MAKVRIQSTWTSTSICLLLLLRDDAELFVDAVEGLGLAAGQRVRLLVAAERLTVGPCAEDGLGAVGKHVSHTGRGHGHAGHQEGEAQARRSCRCREEMRSVCR